MVRGRNNLDTPWVVHASIPSDFIDLKAGAMDIISSSQMVIRIGNLKESDEKYVQCLDSGFSESSTFSQAYLHCWRTSSVDHKSNGCLYEKYCAFVRSIPSINDVTSIDQLCKDVTLTTPIIEDELKDASYTDLLDFQNSCIRLLQSQIDIMNGHVSRARCRSGVDSTRRQIYCSSVQRQVRIDDNIYSVRCELEVRTDQVQR
jgi:hypothetical protein